MLRQFNMACKVSELAVLYATSKSEIQNVEAIVEHNCVQKELCPQAALFAEAALVRLQSESLLVLSGTQFLGSAASSFLRPKEL